MFDFSPTGILVALIASAWGSVSPAVVFGAVCALAAAVLAGGSSARSARAMWLVVALALAALVGIRQGAETDGARRVMARDHALALQAERERADLAEGITRDLAEQATRVLAEAQASIPKLKGIDDAMAKDGRRDGVCLDRGMSRRLRNL